MAYSKNPTKEQREAWKKAAEEKKAGYENTLKDIVENFKEDPGKIAEFLSWSATFHQYSARNMMLIMRQNPEAMYCRSFADWKKEGCSVKKGERGLGVFVPVQTTMLYTDRGAVLLSTATDEEKKAYKEGRIEGKSYLNFKIGTVFDITQTDFPPERYPEFLGPGADSIPHEEMYEALKVYAEKELGCKVVEEDMMAAAHRGYYQRGTRKIGINDILKGVEKLSTLTHEIGHAIMHSKESDSSLAKKELEADAISIMLQSKCGVPLTDARKSHLKDHFLMYEEEAKAKDEKVEITDILQGVYEEYEKLEAGIDAALQNSPAKDMQKDLSAKIEKAPKRKEKQPDAEMEL